MGKQINQYTKVRTAATSKADDLIDWDSTEDGGLTWESARMDRGQFFTLLNNNITNLYNADGTLLNNREVTAATFFTRWSGGDVVVKMNDEINDYAFLTQDNSAVEKVRMGYDQVALSGMLEVSSASGIFLKANDDELFVNTNMFYVNAVGVGVNTTSPSTLVQMDIHTPNGSIGCLGLFGDRPGGASIGDNEATVEFFYNDNGGARTMGGSIITRVDAAPTPGNVNMSMTLNNAIKIQPTKRVLITPNPATGAAIALLEVRADSTTGSIALLAVAESTTSKQSLVLMNGNGDTNLSVRADGKTTWNLNNLSTSDFNLRGGSDNNLFYLDASVDSIGIGTNTPNTNSIMEIVSTSDFFAIRPMTSVQASAITPFEGAFAFTSDTNATFLVIGLHCYENGTWNKL